VYSIRIGTSSNTLREIKPTFHLVSYLLIVTIIK